MEAVAWDLYDFHTQYAAFQQTPRLQAKQDHWWRYLLPRSETARSDPRNQGSIIHIHPCVNTYDTVIRSG